MICPACGRKPAHTFEQYQYLESGLENVAVKGVGIFRCKCGQEYVQLPGAQEIHDQVASKLLNKPSLLTGQEAKFIRKWLCLTSEAMADVLGYTRVSVSRWENKGLQVATDRALRLYASVVRNIPIDFENLFSSMKDKPQKDFRIVLDGTKTVLQYSVGAVAPPLASPATNSSRQETLANFNKTSTVISEAAQAANQELALAA